MSGWAIFWLIVAVVIVLMILLNLRDLLRYIKISNM
jgi:hypothetical protein